MLKDFVDLKPGNFLGGIEYHITNIIKSSLSAHINCVYAYAHHLESMGLHAHKHCMDDDDDDAFFLFCASAHKFQNKLK